MKVTVAATQMACSHQLNFRAHEVLFYQFPGTVKMVQHLQLHSFLCLLVRVRNASHQRIELLSDDGLVQLFVVLGLLRQVRQQVRNGKNRIGLVFAYGKVKFASVFPDDFPVQGKGAGHPLVFLYPAIVMSFAQGKINLFIEGVLLQIKPRRINMGNEQFYPLLQGAFPRHCQADSLVRKNLVAFFLV